MRLCLRHAAAAALLVAGVATSAHAAARYDPRLRFRTISTAHFDIHAHQREEALARRLAPIVERVRAAFEHELGVPRGRVQVILVDQTDVSNGWATPIPYDTIEITALPPIQESIIGRTTDWLELVFTHEYTHILHLDRSRGWFGGLRRVFGRVPVVFPNAFLPVWQIEGIATYEESRMTGEGRVPAGDFGAIVDVAAHRGRFVSRDRASGGLNDWPAGLAPYAYGAYFHQYLAEQYGPERIAALTSATAGRVPFFGAGAFRKIFGKSVDQLWSDFRTSREGRLTMRRSRTEADARRLTRHGFQIGALRVTPDGTAYYALSDPHRFPALMRLPRSGPPQRVVTRYLGNRTSVQGSWIVYDALEYVRSVALYSDLFAVRTNGEGRRRLTRGARAADPDLSPDGARVACTVQMTGRRALAIADFRPSAATPLRPEMLDDDPDADFSGPRWSPDGRSIVAERRTRDGYALVLFDVATRAGRPLLSSRDARLVTPSWSPDGSTVLFAADPSGAPFNVFAIDVASNVVYQVTDTMGGAQMPELSSDGTLTYVGYSTDGYDLFSVPTERRGWLPIDAFGTTAASPEQTRTAEPSATAPSGAAWHDYRPGPTLRPTFWSPIVESDAGEVLIGAGTGITDALGRHSYAIDAAWTSGRARPDWSAVYVYDRLRPTLFASYADDTDPIRAGTIRSREVLVGALLPFRTVRRTQTVLAAVDVDRDELECDGCGLSLDAVQRRSARGGWLYDSRHQFGYSISAEEGLLIEVAAEASRTSLAGSAAAGAAVTDVRLFQRVFRPHTVLAARLASATAYGDARGRRVFSAGGSGPSIAAFDFGRNSIALLRGFSTDDLIGSHAGVANVDLRFPIARPQRGAGSWPVFLRAIHGALFFDGGSVWERGFRLSDARTALGGELSLDTVLGHYLPVTFAAGAAWTRDPVVGSTQAAAFARIGRAF